LIIATLQGTADFSLAGGYHYTSGKTLQLVLPAALLNMFAIGVGCILSLNGLPALKWVLSSGLFTLATGALQEPRAQAFGETALLWGIAMALFSMGR